MWIALVCFRPIHQNRPPLTIGMGSLTQSRLLEKAPIVVQYGQPGLNLVLLTPPQLGDDRTVTAYYAVLRSRVLHTPKRRNLSVRVRHKTGG